MKPAQLKLFFVLAAAFCIGGLSHAAPRDPAPIPDEVVARLHARLSVQDLPLVQEIERHKREILSLIDQTATVPQGATKTALLAKSHELRTLKVSLSSQERDPNRLAALGQRLEYLAGIMEDVGAGKASTDRVDAVKRMLRESSSQSPVSSGASPRGFRYYDPAAEPAPPPSTLKPAYAMHDTSGPLLLAAAGGVGALASMLPELPDATACNWQVADLNDDGRNVRITQEIRDLAAQLDYSPARILEWMKREIAFEPYYGALKGSQGVLYAKAGGPTDIASLTIALLRASNIPARYVRGMIRVRDAGTAAPNGKIQRWLGTKSYDASVLALSGGNFPGAKVINGANGPNGVEFAHVWVEACLPYAHYRGSRLGSGGERWIPLDASFRNPDYQPGVSVAAVDLDYATYLAKRTNELPAEHYEGQIQEYLARLSPHRTIDEVLYAPKLEEVRFDVLPASLPYQLFAFVNWSNNGKPDTAVLPDSHQYRFSIDLKNSAGISLGPTFNTYLPDIALNRLTLSFKGANASAEQALRSWQRDGQAATALPCPLSVVPSVRADGVERYAGDTAVDLCSVGNQLNLQVMLDELASPQRNSSNFANISAANLHALQAYAFQGSDRLIAERVAKLLATVRANTDPNAAPDDIEGEFLHIVGLKYMRYATDSGRRMAQLAETTNLYAPHLGLTSTQAKVQYAFDMPLGVTREGYLIDVPAFLYGGRNLTTGQRDNQAFLRTVYQASALESYVWQENARLDAVSTVRGLQFAKEQGIEVLQINNASDWASQKCKLTNTCGNGALNSNPSGTNYAASQVAEIESNYVNQGFKLTIPRRKIQYNQWTGAVYAAVSNAGIGMFISGGYNGGYTIGLPTYYTYTPSINTGYSYYTPPLPPVYIPSLPPPPPPAIISSAVGLGVTPQSTFAGDPVNLVNGNLYHNERDIAIKGRGGFPIVFERAYNSRDAKDGPLGYGWTHSLNHYLLFSDDSPDGASTAADSDSQVSSIVWVDGSGSRKSISTNSGATAFTTPTGFHFNVSREVGTSRFIVSEKSGLKYVFENKTATVPANDTAAWNGRARLVAVEDRHGNRLDLAYSGDQLATVTDSLNRVLQVTYSGSRISEIRDWVGRKWQYTYNGAGDLVEFKNPRAAAGKQSGVSYTYYTEADGKYLGHMMKRYTLPRGNGMSFEYYINGRVFRHYPSDRPDEATAFSYNDFRRETVVTDPDSHTRHHFFDRFGNPEQIIDDDGAVTRYTYDCRSESDCPNPYNKLSETDATGLTIEYSYDTAGNLTKTRFPAASTQVLRLDFAANTYGQPRRIQDVRNNWTVIRYDGKGNPTDEIRLKAGKTAASCVSAECAIPATTDISAWTQRQYDAYGNVSLLKRIRDFATQAGPTLATDWNDTVNAVNGLNSVKFTRVGDKTGDGAADAADVASQTFDALGRIKQGIDSTWYPISITEYDEVDRPIRQVDAIGRTVETDFDANGNAIERRLRKGGTLLDRSLTTYDSADRATASTNNAGQPTSYEHDVRGNLIANTNPDAYTTRSGYDGQGRLTAIWDAEGLLNARDYDIGGRLQSITDSHGITISHTYHGPDQGGRLKRSELPAIQGAAAGRAVEADYDAAGNVIKRRQVGSDGTIREHLAFYDAQNRPVREVSPIMDPAVSSNRRQVCRVYNALGDPTELWVGPTTDSTSATCNYADGNLKKQVTWAYDDFGRRLKETDGLGRIWSWTYDTYGNVLTQKDAKNQTTTFTWAAGGLPDTRKDHANRLTTWTHDDLGQVKRVGDGNVAYSYAYDAAHRLQTVSDSRGYNTNTLTYSWSHGGLLNRMTDGDGRATDYLYDSVGRRTGQWLPNGAYFAWGYDARGLPAWQWSDVGIMSEYHWNEDGSLQGLAHVQDSATIVSTHTYLYNAFGQRSQTDDNLAGSGTRWRHGYDALGRLKESTTTALAPTAGSETLYRSWRYDAFGNRERQTYASGQWDKYTYDAAQQLKQIDRYNAANVLQGALGLLAYDANGSLTSKQTGNGTLTLGWDESNQLKTASTTGTGATSQSYTYDPQGRRISKTVGSSTTYYLYDGQDIHAEYAGWSQPQALIGHGPGIDAPLAKLPLSEGNYGDARYYHANGQGSIDVVSRAQAGADVVDGAAVWDPWGALYLSGGSAPPTTGYAYQGRERDETGLIYYRARYYDPSALAGAVGRFVSRDPIGYAGGLNPYAAFDNDPINLGDPSGTTAMARGIQGLINQSYYDNVARAFGFTAPSSGSQSLATVNYRPSVYAQSSTANLQTALAVASAVPLIGSVASLASAGLAIAEGDAVGAVFGVAGAIPGVGSAKAAVRGADLLLDAARVEGAAARGTVVFNNGFRTADGKFASVAGQASPGTSTAMEFANHLQSNGANVVGTEMPVMGPLGRRTYDIVTRSGDRLWGIEVKTGGASKGAYQDFSDQWINKFGAPGIGRLSGQTVSGSSTVFLP
jgi:RHS repeat-associated protein